MKIDEIKERTDEIYETNQDKYSRFVLVDYTSYPYNNHELTETLPLENQNCDIEIGKNSLIITDSLGNILLNFLDCDKYIYTVTYVNMESIIIKRQNKNQELFDIICYQYDEDNKELLITGSFPRVKEFIMFPNEEKYLIRYDNGGRNCNIFSLRSNIKEEKKKINR